MNKMKKLKQILSLLVAVTITLLSLNSLTKPLITCATSTVWTGVVANAYNGGTGTVANPYQIANGEQLALMAYTAQSSQTTLDNKYFVLTDDILLNDVSNSNWQNNNPREWTYGTGTGWAFRGNLNGQGHVIKGLYINSSALQYSGLFNIVNAPSGSTTYIKNIGITDSYIRSTGAGDNYAGAFAGIRGGSGSNVVISQCFSDSSITLVGKYTGGIVGGNGQARITFNNCYSSAVLNGTSVKGGIFGNNWNTGTLYLNYCYNTQTSVGLVGNVPQFATYTGSYTTGTTQTGLTVLTLAQMTGVAAQTNMTAFNFVGSESIWMVVADGTPVLRMFNDITPMVFSGTVASTYDSGSGTQSDPYQISNGEQLAFLCSTTKSDGSSTAGKYYVLTSDILLNDVTNSDWRTDSPNEWIYGTGNALGTQAFRGTLNGQGHIIYGIYINENASTYSGLFVGLNGSAVVQNLGIMDSYIKSTGIGDNFAGPIAGARNNWSIGSGVIISQCFSDASVTVDGKYTGGIIGGLPFTQTITINNCYSSAVLNGVTLKGGIIGNLWQSGNVYLNYCYNTQSGIGLVGNLPQYAIYNGCYTTGAVQSGISLLTLSQMTGDTAKSIMTAFDFANTWMTNAEETPFLKVNYVNSDGICVGSWDTYKADGYAGGTGTQSNPYQIQTASQLALLVSTCISNSASTAGVFYELSSDIYLNDVSSHNWRVGALRWYHATSEAQGFRGTFDGQGHVVHGIYLDMTTDSETLVFGGLFSSLYYGSVVKNVGVSNSFIKASASGQTSFIGTISGYVRNIVEENGTDYAQISGCFGDNKILLCGTYVGGMIGGSPQPSKISDSYFTGSIKAVSRAGGIYGSFWAPAGATATNCYAITEDKDPIIGGGIVSNISMSHVYNVKSQAGTIFLSRSKLQGTQAETYLDGFDFTNTWSTVLDGSPVLRIYNTDAYSLPAIHTTLSFVSNGGNSASAITGQAGANVTWPTVTRSGFTLGGWYVYDTLDVKYPFDTFPNYNMTLYAKWIQNTINQNFETYTYIAGGNGLDSDYEHYVPSVSGYSTNYVHGGSDSLCRLGNTMDAENFAVMDASSGSLEQGKEYTLSFWVYADSISSSNPIKLIYSNSADLTTCTGEEENIVNLSSLQSQTWQEITLTFTAQAKYVGIQTPGQNTMYFDDITFTYVGDPTPSVPGIGNWDGPSGYAIIIPTSVDSNVEKSAQILQTYLEDKYAVNVPISNDEADITDKEFLVGNTNRPQSSNSLAEDVYDVTISGDKVAFRAGYYVGLEKAIYQFINNERATNSISTFSKVFDFSPVKFSTYQYVWGDEFDEDSLDTNKWSFGNDMGGASDMSLISSDTSIVKLSDGLLQMNARRYFDPDNSLIKYGTTPSICTKDTMNFKYGYLEMRAKVPFKQGAWPSLWMKSTGTLATRDTTSYFTEVDIFEVFSSPCTATPNLHKWYSNGNHSQVSSKTSYTFSNYTNLSNEYHIYGFKWTPTEMSMYVDGTNYMTFDLTNDFDSGGDMNGFQDCLYIILNNHIFSPNSSWIPTGAQVNSSTQLPMNYSVDWIRLYQQTSEGELYTVND